MFFKRLSEEERAQIVELYKAGAKQKDLAVQFSVTQPSISYLLRSKGVDVVRILTTEQVQEIRYALTVGRSTIKELADKYKCSYSNIRNIGTGKTYKNVPLSEEEKALNEKMQELKDRRKEVLDKTP